MARELVMLNFGIISILAMLSLGVWQLSSDQEVARNHFGSQTDKLMLGLGEVQRQLRQLSSLAAASMCPPITFVRPFRKRKDLGAELYRLGLRGTGVEVGVQLGQFSYDVLEGWKIADTYVMVDLWKQQRNYDDAANVDNKKQDEFMQYAVSLGERAKDNGFVKNLRVCRNYSTVCVHLFENASLDFVYVDARHDRKGVLEDIKAFWPKLRNGGVMAGHDYLEQRDMGAPQKGVIDDYTLNYDGTRDMSGRVVKGAVDDFFAGEAEESPAELRRCPRQVAVTYHEGSYNTWVVGK